MRLEIAKNFQWLMLGLVFSIAAAFQNSADAQNQEFRVESHVYDESSKLPVAQNVTLFSKGLVYDIQLSNDQNPRPLETIIFDSLERRLILLDHSRSVRLELLDAQLLKLVDNLRRDIAKDERLGFLVNNKFTQDIDVAAGWAVLSSPEVTYRVQGQRPKDESMIPLYCSFLDQFTYLSATAPRKVPPFARIKVNRAIRELGWFPSQIEVRYEANTLFRQNYSARSTHVLIDELSSADRQKITEAKQQWTAYKAVDLGTYRGLARQPKLDRLRNEARLKNDPTLQKK